MLPIGENSVIGVILSRLSRSKFINETIVATSINVENDILEKHVLDKGYRVSRGSEENVLERFYEAAKLSSADIIIRITADCPFVDAGLLDEMIEDFLNSNVDYESNTMPPSYPDGLDIEIFNFNTLHATFKNAKEKYDKEHVTLFIRSS